MNQPPQQPPPYPPYGQYPPQGYPPPQQESFGAVDLLVPTNPLAAVACWVGILSVLTCYGGLLLGPIALATGVLSLKKGAMIRETAYGRGSSLVRSWVGIVTGALGTLVGIAAIVIALLGRH
jgi:hypothetical protein